MTGYSQKGRAARDVIRAALFREWDPIGINCHPQIENEYDDYVGPAYALLEAGASAEQLFEYLWQVETEYMGLGTTEAARARTREFAERLWTRVTAELSRD